MNTDKGIIYVATGQRFVDEAKVSARSVRKVYPEMPIVLYTDIQEKDPLFNQVISLNEVRGNCYDKVEPLLESPFEKTLFLDTDTYLCEEIDEIWRLLDRFELMLTHTPIRDPNPIDGIPPSFTEFNTGVIAFKRSENVTRVLQEWVKIYGELEHKADQPALRKTLWENQQIKFYVLPSEYNFRTIVPGFIGGGSPVKIIHGRHKDFAKLAQRLNKNDKPRVMIDSYVSQYNGEVIRLRSIWQLLKSFLKRLLGKSG